MSAPVVEATSMKMIVDIIAWGGTFMAFALMMAPIVLFINIFKSKKEGEPYNYKSIPELMLIFNIGCGCLWFSYWFRKDNHIPCYSALANTTAALIFAYLYLYCYAQGNIGKFLLYSFVATDLIIQMMYLCVYIITNEEIIGKTAMIVNILMFAAPGQSIFTVLTTGNYNLIPIVSTYVGLACSGFWFSYGVLEGLINVIIPNGIGIGLSVIQILIFYYFYCTRKEDTKEKQEVMLEDKEKSIN